MSVTIPRFTFSPASSREDTNSGHGQFDSSHGAHHIWGTHMSSLGGDGDPLDFDLLAEYLLDDGNAGTTKFEFGVETPPDSYNTPPGVVSPDQTQHQSFADPLADATWKLEPAENADAFTLGGTGLTGTAQVQHMIAFQAAANQQRANASTIPVSAPSAIIMPNLPQGMPLTAFQTTHGPMLPSHLPTMQQMIVHQHKRPRTNEQNSVAAALSPVTSTMAVNGHCRNHRLPSRTERTKSQAQVDRRKERNRILARRTRLRKKFFFESLQKDVTDLQRENFVLKEIVRSRIQPDAAKGILDSCTANDELPAVIAELNGESMINTQDFNLVRSVQKSQQCFVITDPSLQDNPIVYASPDFLDLTGYAREDVLGRNCRFLQGTETSQEKIEQIRKAVSFGEDVTVTFINYTADGTAFWNNLFIAALRDAQNNIVNFIGVLAKVASPEPEDPEAGKLLPGETVSSNRDNLASQNDPSVSLSTVSVGAVEAAKAADSAVMAIEGAVAAAVAAAPRTVTANGSHQSLHGEDTFNSL